MPNPWKDTLAAICERVTAKKRLTLKQGESLLIGYQTLSDTLANLHSLREKREDCIADMEIEHDRGQEPPDSSGGC